MLVAAWVVAVLLTVACVEHVLFHWPVMGQMALEDWFVRGGLLLLMADGAACAACLLFDVAPLTVVEWVALPAQCVAGGCIVGGFLILLWKYRRHKATAALQPNVGTPPEGD
jgi:hypothetical protein